MKVCNMCKCNKSEDDFNKRNGGKYLKSICKDCEKIRRAEARSNDIRKYFIDIVRTSKQQATRRKIKDHEINVDFLIEMYNKQNGLCSVSKIKMTHIAGKGKVITNASIDRIDSSKGYTKENVRLVCLGINLLKMDATEEEFQNFLKQIVLNYTS